MEKIIAVKNSMMAREGCAICQSIFKQSCDMIKELYGNKNYGCSSSRTHFELVKDDNSMPEIKAGMMVELREGELRIVLPTKHHSCGLGLYLSDGTGSLNPLTAGITKLWNTGDVTYYEFFTNNRISNYYKLIWEKKSPKQTKIEAIEDNILKLQEQVKELKGEIRNDL